MISRNGVIAPTSHQGNQLFSELGTVNSDLPASTIDRLVTLAIDNGLDALWILPGSIESKLAGQLATSHGMITETDAHAVRPHQNEEGQITCMHAWAKRKNNEYNPYRNTMKDPHRTIRIFFPEHDERWGLQEVTHPHELLNTIDLVEISMGYPLDWSPGATGTGVLRFLNSPAHRAHWLRRVDFTGTPWLPTDEEIANGYGVPLSSNGTKKHMPTDMAERFDMTEPLFFHVYDKRYAFGGACTSINVGEGQPEFYTYGQIPWDKKHPGIWRVGDRWMYTPETAYMIEEGWIQPEQIKAAYVWKDYHQTMRTFAELFWNVEIACKNNPHAKRMGKTIRSQGLGWLAMDTRQFRDNPELETVGDLYRPDIWGAVVSEARTKMNRKINQLYRQGFEAVWWNFDELGFFSNEVNPQWAVPIFERTDSMGGFRHRYSLRVDADILAAFSSPVSFADCHKLLLNKWKHQQKLQMDQTMLVPATGGSNG